MLEALLLQPPLMQVGSLSLTLRASGAPHLPPSCAEVGSNLPLPCPGKGARLPSSAVVRGPLCSDFKEPCPFPACRLSVRAPVSVWTRRSLKQGACASVLNATPPRLGSRTQVLARTTGAGFN